MLSLENITKSFGRIEVLRGLDLSVDRGEFITLLGPSGCGKTTILRIIAGLETADSGRVLMDGIDVNNLSPDKRGVNMVFQNYALFPHMNVEQNVGYSLKLKKMAKPEIRQAVKEALAMVQLDGFEKRRPNELSGGQKQRVAVARAIINKPKALLLDEPLGALDLQLRRQLQGELKRIQKQLGISFVYITHDQEEALAMSDRVAVMRNGVFEQTDSAVEVYKNPKTAFVARFVGNANLISRDDKEFFAVRAENIILTKPSVGGQAGGGESPSAGRPCLKASVTEKSFSGGLLRVTAVIKSEGPSFGEEICSCVPGIDSPFELGDDAEVSWLPTNAVTVRKE